MLDLSSTEKLSIILPKNLLATIKYKINILQVQSTTDLNSTMIVVTFLTVGAHMENILQMYKAILCILLHQEKDLH